MKRKIKMVILRIICIVIAIGVINFISVSQKSKERFTLYKEKAKVIQTTYGNLSYIDEGEGETILIIHGICGGYDQAYDSLSNKVDKYRILAPSRFGYPGSDIPKNASVEKQVEAFEQLLVQLHIDRVYVLATSAGGTSAIKFSLMHPERIKGLILFSSGYPAIEAPIEEIDMAGPPAFLVNDFMMWLISPLFKPIMGMESSMIKVIMPLENRKKGVAFDGTVTNTVMVNHYQDYDMSKLKVPVLIIHSKDDKIAKFDMVEPWINRIPDCTFVPLESGGHLMKGNENIIDKALKMFVDKTK